MAEGYSTGSFGKSPGLLSKQLKKLVDDLVTAGATQDSSGAISGLVPLYIENVQTASYTLVLGDAGLVVVMNVASANTLTVPPNSSVAFPVGSVISIYQLGAGQTTVTAGAAVTIQSPSSHVKLTGQYSSAALRKRATDEWVLAGDLSA